MTTSDAFETCPTDVVRASVERVWELLTNPSLLGWVDAKVVEAPARPLTVGDCVLMRASFGLRVTWTVLSVDRPHQLGLEIGLPFGMTNHETIILSRLDAESCRVTFS